MKTLHEIKTTDFNNYPGLIITGYCYENLYFKHDGKDYFTKCFAESNPPQGAPKLSIRADW